MFWFQFDWKGSGRGLGNTLYVWKIIFNMVGNNNKVVYE